MDTLTALSSVIAVNILAWLSPGPNMVLVISTSLYHGRRDGFMVGAGLAFASLLWAGLAMLGIGILFEHAPFLVITFKLIGAGYLIWLGAKSLRATLTPRAFAILPDRKIEETRGSFLSGFLVSMTNPNAAFFFGSILSAFVPADSSAYFKIFVVAICGALGLLLHGITALTFSSAMVIRAVGAARAKINLCFGITLIGLGGLVLYNFTAVL